MGYSFNLLKSPWGPAKKPSRSSCQSEHSVSNQESFENQEDFSLDDTFKFGLKTYYFDDSDQDEIEDEEQNNFINIDIKDTKPTAVKFKLVDLSNEHYRDRLICLSSKNMFSVIVGRQKEYSHDSRILLDNPTVSKNHAEIYHSHGFFYIKDRSKNGK